MVRRVTVSRLCIFLVSALVLLLWYTWCQHSQLPDQLGPPSGPPKTHLLILSSWRSGSTFLGQLFNQNPSVFYLVEPTRALWAARPDRNPSALHGPMTDLLRSLFLCDMSALKPYLPQSQFISDIYGWSSSRALCSPPACHNLEGLDLEAGQQCYHMCHLSPFERAEEACQAHSHVVAKEVRFLDLKALYPLLRDPRLNLKILHLVRDPRAIVLSRTITRGLSGDDAIVRKAQNSSTTVYSVMREICGAQVKIFHAALEEAALRGRYMIVRYEDLLRDPMGHVRDWYDSMGLSAYPKLAAWVHQNARLSGVKNGASLHSARGSISMKPTELWRKKLTFRTVQAIQHVCRQEMDTFGYRSVKNPAEQADQTLDLVLAQKSPSDRPLIARAQTYLRQKPRL